MRFGLRNVPAMFQSILNSVIGDLQGCAVYLDDIVVYLGNSHLGNSPGTYLEPIHRFGGRKAYG